MTPHAIHFGDVRPALEQRFVHRLFIGERQTGRRRCQQRRASTGNQAQYEIVGREPDNLLADTPRCLDAGSVRHRMGGLNDLDALAGNGVTVACDHQPFERTAHVVLDRTRHRRRCLAGPDHHHSPARPRRQMQRQAKRRLRGVDGGIEHASQQLTRCAHWISRKRGLIIDKAPAVLHRCRSRTTRSYVRILVRRRRALLSDFEIGQQLKRPYHR